eukprot:TRINITY_DN88488_c0_g1_i1.p1 TRINITY_DN88488_c0_g1~~TRINITY_DN88488_c0_g1_i1.p1  ORF type:complete len:201 (+),score=10.77 TRINITY_DN88488_c0_g1_i1:41-643(+)
MAHNHGAADVNVNTTMQHHFCNSDLPTTMHMTGFRSAINSNPATTECIVLWLQEWQLNTPEKFAGAVVGVFALAVNMEALNMLRRVLCKKHPQKLLTIPLALLLYTMSLFIGYLLMLVAMTYNSEMFFAVILGLLLGNALFGGKNGVLGFRKSSKQSEPEQPVRPAHNIEAHHNDNFYPIHNLYAYSPYSYSYSQPELSP